MLRLPTVALALLLAAGASIRPCAAQADTRASLVLNGTWQLATTDDPSDAEPADGWADTAVPGATNHPPREPGHYLWYRRDVAVPEAWSAGRIVLDVGGARYDPHVYVDGRFVGGQLDGFTPFRVDITGSAVPGRTVHLAIRCQDRTAIMVGGKAPAPGASAVASMLAPAGGYKDFCGPWDDVVLRAMPAVAIDDTSVVVVTSVRSETLTVSGRTVGEAAGLVAGARVLDHGKVVLSLPPAAVVDGAWTLGAPFPHARTWSPEDPHLYTLELTLGQPTADPVDTYRLPIGFKEIWTQGPDFYLNGVKRHLLASATWPVAEPVADEEIRQRIRAMKAGHVVAFRLHNQLWPESWLRIADEEGMLIVDESPLYTDDGGQYAYADPRFDANYRDEIAGMIRRDRNHACLALWSLENETLFMSNQKFDPKLPDRLANIGRYAKSLDPNHPITFEADQDPGGAADVIGLHYPHEMPDNYAYPNTADWLGTRITTEAAGGMLGQRSTSFFWERDKPLYIGEFLWAPSSDYSVGSIFYGDDAYLNRSDYHRKAQADAVYDQVLGYRRAGVSGICPWTAFDFGAVLPLQREFYDRETAAYAPIAAFLRTRSLRAFSGDTLPLTFDVFNDSPASRRLVLRLTASSGKVVATRALTLPPGGYRPVPIALKMPTASTRTAIALREQLLADGKAVYDASVPVRVYPRMPLRVPAGWTLTVLDPSGAWPQSVRTPAVLAAARPRTLLIVAPGAFGGTSAGSLPTIRSDAPEYAQLRRFLKEGGRAIVLDQPTLGPLRLGLETAVHASTMTFPLRKGHPILAGLESADLRYWGADNYVTSLEIRRPQRFGLKAVTVSGGPDSLGTAPIVEGPDGKGWVVVIEALVGEKWATEPAAARILQNAVNYITARPAISPRRVLVASNDDAFREKLQVVGIDSEPLGPEGAVGRSLIIDGDASVAGALPAARAVLASGGTVYWRRPTAGALAAFAETVGGPAIAVVPSESGPSLGDRDSPLLDGISREDLTYTTISSGWNRQMLADPHGAGAIFLPAPIDEGHDVPLPASSLQLSGGSRSGTAVDLDAAGTVSFTSVQPTRGLHLLTIAASTAAAGTIAVEVDGRQSSWLPIAGDDRRDYRALVDLPAGRPTITLTAAGPVRLSAVSLGDTLRLPSGVSVLAMPGCVVSYGVLSGRVVLDWTRWDTDAANKTRGARYASALFSNLDLAFAPPDVPGIQSIPLPAFHLVGTSAYFEQTADELTFRNDGLVEGKVRFEDTADYLLHVDGYSTPFQSVYGHVRIFVDGKPAGEATLASNVAAWYDAGRVRVTAGVHTIGIAFTNDQSDAKEDRNLFLRGVGVTSADR